MPLQDEDDDEEDELDEEALTEDDDDAEEVSAAACIGALGRQLQAVAHQHPAVGIGALACSGAAQGTGRRGSSRSAQSVCTLTLS